MREREIIRRFFDFAPDSSVLTGIGDDAAILRPPPGAALAVSTDSLCEGVHFFADVSPFLLARKAAAVSLSDMAAMGARPLWLFVALSTAHNSDWIAAFADGLKSSAAEFNYTIAGGDLCRADLTVVNTTVMGAVESAPLLRRGAKAGEQVWISGALGEASLAVHYRKNVLDRLDNSNNLNRDSLNRSDGFDSSADFANVTLSAENLAHINKRLHDPKPRLDIGLRLHGIASAAIDLSDGLVSAATDIAEQSHCGIVLHADAMPIAPPLAALPHALQLQLMLAGGDDYELLFCAPPQHYEAIKLLGAYCIGEVTESEKAGVSVEGGGGNWAGYEHDFGGGDNDEKSGEPHG